MAITLREQYLEGFVSSHEMDCMAPQVAAEIMEVVGPLIVLLCVC